ncbi:MAG: helix-turn-helix domain-containing protein, partial [Pseudonocardiaceae bacterium]
LTREARPPRAAEERGRSRSRWLRDRFSAEELQAMIDLYRSGTPARMVAERYGVGVRSVKRLLHGRGVRRRPPDMAS